MNTENGEMLGLLTDSLERASREIGPSLVAFSQPPSHYFQVSDLVHETVLQMEHGQHSFQ
jgi:hypothetical protein